MQFGSILLQILQLTLSWAASLLQNDLQSNALDPSKRVDCGPEPSITQDLCVKRGCIWSPTSAPLERRIPYCYYPPDTGYFVVDQVNPGNKWQKSPNSVKNPYCDDAQTLNFEQQEIGSGIRLVIGTDNSFVPDIALNRSPQIQSSEKLKVKIRNTTAASFTVERDDGTRIWDTSIGGLIFGEKYIQISAFIPTYNIYGFGEHIHQTLKHDLTDTYKTWPMFARDQGPDSASESRQNLYGVHNFYMGLEENGKAHGVFMLNSHPQEVVTGPAPHLTYRAIGGRFEFYFLPGPSPSEVVQQYQQIIGRPYLPAYWALGYQFCRYGFTGLAEVKDTVRRIQAAQIPFDVIFADIDYMDRYKDFTTGKEKWGDFPTYMDQLHQKNVKLTLIFDPAIEVDYDSFSRALDADASFLSWPRADLVQREIQDLYPLAKDTTIMLGVVWPDAHVAFPDFYDDTNKTQQWWIDEFKTYHGKLGFDGIWIDMNEMSVFATNDPNPWYYNNPDHPDIAPLKCPVEGPDSELDNPPYKTWASYLINKDLCDVTLCMFATTNRGKQPLVKVKSLYGLKETIVTNQALKQSTGKRGQVISRSTFASSGHYGGHWLGDNTARWEDLRTTIIGAQEFNIFGITHVGSDVCGFNGDTNEELCLRWQQLGAFHSFFRNHNTIGAKPQDPPQWQSVAQTTRTANLWRYRHLPYLNSLHFIASKEGGTVVRPVFFEFPKDPETFNLSYEFMWGSSILVMPVTQPDVLTVDGYLPEDTEWYYLYSNLYGSQASSGSGTFDAPKNSSSPVFLRGGSIIPRQAPALTTTDTRKNHFQLAIACNKKVDPKNTAFGEFYWDDGESWVDVDSDFSNVDYYKFNYTFKYDAQLAQLDINLVKIPKNRLTLPPIEQIEVFGYLQSATLRSVKVNDQDAQISLQESSYSGLSKVLRLSRTDKGFIQLNDHLDKWTVTWKNTF